MKYEWLLVRVFGFDFSLNLNSFNIVGCYFIDEDYFVWLDVIVIGLQVNISELYGVLGCFYCGNVSVFVLCLCGKLLCIDGLDDVICLWCEIGLLFSNDGGNINFDVNRGRG